MSTYIDPVTETWIEQLQARITELEKQSHSEALIRSELEEQIDFFTRSMHFTPANTYEVLTGRIKELELENEALRNNLQLIEQIWSG